MYIYNGVAAYKVRTSTNVVDQTKFYVNVKEKSLFMDKYFLIWKPNKQKSIR